MEKKEGRKTDQTKQRKHSAPRNPLAHNNNTNSSSSNDRSSSGSHSSHAHGSQVPVSWSSTAL